MKQIEAVRAYKVLKGLGNEKMSMETAYKLFRQRKALKPAYEFQAEREKAIMEKYKAKPDRNGMFRTEDPEDLAQLQNDLKELAEMESDLKVEPVVIENAEGMRISPDEMEALENVIEFKC